METIPFLDSAGLGPGGIQSDHERSEFEGSSLDDGIVKAEVWTVQGLTTNSPNEVTPADTTDRLFGRRPRESTLARIEKRHIAFLRENRTAVGAR
jgi:hypothetical protein